MQDRYVWVYQFVFRVQGGDLTFRTHMQEKRVFFERERGHFERGVQFREGERSFRERERLFREVSKAREKSGFDRRGLCTCV